MTDHYGLIGYPLGYSLSPRLHNHFFRQFHIDAEYESMPVKEAQLADIISRTNIDGFNVTIPYKEKILPLLDHITEEAASIGAVNTVRHTGGKLIGTNTDAPGFLQLIDHETGLNLKDKKVILLGAGGAAKAISYALLTRKVKAIYLYDINRDQVQSLLMKAEADKRYDIIQPVDALSSDILNRCDVLINATPVGMEKTKGKSILDIASLKQLPSTCVVVDIIYNPEQTKLLRLSESLGLKTTNGLGMLAGQGILAQDFWFDQHLTYEEAKNILRHGF